MDTGIAATGSGAPEEILCVDVGAGGGGAFIVAGLVASLGIENPGAGVGGRGGSTDPVPRETRGITLGALADRSRCANGDLDARVEGRGPLSFRLELMPGA